MERLFNAGLTNTLDVCLVDRHGSGHKRVCDDPSKYVSWDGIHLTEAAYRIIANSLLEGPYTNPQITTSCISQNRTTNLLQLQ